MHISPRAKIGRNVRFEYECRVYGASVIEDGCFVGNACVLGHPRRANLLKAAAQKDVLSAFDELSAGCVLGSNTVVRSGAVIYEATRLAESVETGHGVLIREDVEIGKNSRLGSGSIIDGRVTVGSSVNIQSGVYLPPGTVVGHRVFLGPCVTVTNDLYPPSPLVSGVTIEDDAVVGARAVLIAGVKVGRRAVVAAGSVVTKDVPESVVVAGVPATKIRSREEFDARRARYLESHSGAHGS
jgi:acetyltransferase-like isoleucine patch superfamily enzyme